MEKLIIGGKEFTSRLFVGTGKFRSNELMARAIKASGSQMVTVAMKRIDMDNREDDMLRLAACLEEHYPHSLANAVVEEARVRGLNHEEYHSSVEYVVAHGISSTVEGKKVIIGSYHFVFEDEGCRVPEGDEEKFDGLSDAYSHLYLLSLIHI